MVALLTIVVGAAYLLPLTTTAIVGLYTRYMADDFCVAAVARSLGLIQAESFWYLGWTGRYTYVLLADLASLIGPGVAPALPGMLIVMWIAALTWSLAQLARWLPISVPAAALVAGVLVSATLIGIEFDYSFGCD